MSKFALWQWAILGVLLLIVMFWFEWYFLAFLFLLPVLVYLRKRDTE